MRISSLVAALVVLPLLCGSALAVDLFTADFETDTTANWTISSGPTDYVDMDPNDGGEFSSNQANFFFDYSTVGIPPAPNSAAGTTRGLKIMANQDGNFDGVTMGDENGLTGINVSPIGQDFSNVGDYKVTFDLWGNFPGPFPLGSSGTSQLSTFGIATAGNVPNYAGKGDGIFFAATLDGGSGADYRAYSIERRISYQVPPLNPTTDVDALGQPIDSHATYHAGSRNNTAALYTSNFGGVEAPPAQLALYPQQTGLVAAGALGMEWHEVEIAKVGTLVTWKVDGVLLISLETANFVTQPGGGNILFGHADINSGASNDPLRFELLFTLIDNIKVSTIDVSPAANADFNGNGIVDAADYVVWRDHFPTTGSGTQPTGDANGDTNVDQTDYDLWRASFGANLSLGGASGAVPEPGSGTLCLLAAMGALALARRR